MNLFIDSNTFLSFFHLSNEDLEELKKLAVLLTKKKIILWLPEQTKNEFNRNRPNKIADALQRLDGTRIKNDSFPNFCKEYVEYKELRKLLKDVEKTYNKLRENIRKDIDSNNLKADNVICDLFEYSDEIKITLQVVELAKFRSNIGNPPGKKDSLGDAINWESLLAAIPDGEALYFITGDKDYESPLNPDLFNPLLLGEWRQKKASEIKYYKRLSAFFNEQFPDIKLASELEKDLLIKDLADSPNFRETHQVIKKLSKINKFTLDQVERIADATLNNNQVLWVIEDPDIKEFLSSLIKIYPEAINLDSIKSLQNVIEGR